jgi:hypothetical protein
MWLSEETRSLSHEALCHACLGFVHRLQLYSCALEASAFTPATVFSASCYAAPDSDSSPSDIGQPQSILPDGCGKTIRRTEIWKIQSLLRTTHFKGDPAYAMLATAGLSSTTMALVGKRILCCHIDGLGPADHFDGDTRKFHGMCLL